MASLEIKGDVYVINYGEFRSFPIGRIKQDTLYLDSPSRHKPSHSHGIDVLTLQSKQMDYKYIDVFFKKQHWITSRLFWYHHGKHYDMLNNRDELFLRDALFGADKAIKFEKYWKHMETAQLSIFDVLMDPNPQALPSFEQALQEEMEYQESIMERKIEL
jgi:hypothetical protein